MRSTIQRAISGSRAPVSWTYARRTSSPSDPASSSANPWKNTHRRRQRVYRPGIDEDERARQRRMARSELDGDHAAEAVAEENRILDPDHGAERGHVVRQLRDGVALSGTSLRPTPRRSSAVTACARAKWSNCG